MAPSLHSRVKRVKRQSAEWTGNYLDKRRTINSKYYCGLLERLKKAIVEKRPQIKKKKSAIPPKQCTLLQDNENDGQIP